MTYRLILAISCCLTLGACLVQREAPSIEARPEVAEADLRGFYCANTPQFRWASQEAFAEAASRDPLNTRNGLQINQRRDAWSCTEGQGS
jgi:hypothetical protein